VNDQVTAALHEARKAGLTVPLGSPRITRPTPEDPLAADPCALFPSTDAFPATTNRYRPRPLDAVYRADNSDGHTGHAVIVTRLTPKSRSIEVLADLQRIAGTCGDQAVVKGNSIDRTGIRYPPTPVTTTVQPVSVAGAAAFAVLSATHPADPSVNASGRLELDLGSAHYSQTSIYLAEGPYLIQLRGPGTTAELEALIPFLLAHLPGV